MCRESEELIALIDEVAGAAVSMNQGPQNYEQFMRSRSKLINKINAIRLHTDRVTTAIENLHKLI
jgi:hypothetical protein